MIRLPARLELAWLLALATGLAACQPLGSGAPAPAPSASLGSADTVAVATTGDHAFTGSSAAPACTWPPPAGGRLHADFLALGRSGGLKAEVDVPAYHGPGTYAVGDAPEPNFGGWVQQSGDAGYSFSAEGGTLEVSPDGVLTLRSPVVYIHNADAMVGVFSPAPAGHGRVMLRVRCGASAG